MKNVSNAPREVPCVANIAVVASVREGLARYAGCDKVGRVEAKVCGKVGEVGRDGRNVGVKCGVGECGVRVNVNRSVRDNSSELT